VAVEIQGQWSAPIHCRAQFISLIGAPRILLQMKSNFRVRFARYLVVGLRHLRAQFLASDLYKS
jgi:hypothetical protein